MKYSCVYTEGERSLKVKVPIRDIFFISVESALSVDTKKRKQR